MQKLVMLPRKNSCSRDLASHDTTMAAASRLSAFRHRTVPMLSVSTSACMHTDMLLTCTRQRQDIRTLLGINAWRLDGSEVMRPDIVPEEVISVHWRIYQGT